MVIQDFLEKKLSFIVQKNNKLNLKNTLVLLLCFTALNSGGKMQTKTLHSNNKLYVPQNGPIKTMHPANQAILPHNKK